MGATKYGIYTEEQEQIALIAKALAHPARIAILEQLAQQQHCQCGELSSTIELAQSTVSQHLKELKNAELIKGVIEASKPCYCLAESATNELIAFLEKIRAAAAENNACC
jgi:ArsR family transcriptional regulator